MEPHDSIIDSLTGEPVDNVGAEENRQIFQRLLVTAKGYAKNEIRRDVNINLNIGGQSYRSQIDLVVCLNAATPLMVIKCAAGSLGSREREIVAAARLLYDHLVPLAVVTDGRTAVVLNGISGQPEGRGLKAVPSRAEARELLAQREPLPLPPHRREREKLIFRTYDSMNVNVQRNV
jgi:hypothetical protein